MALTWKWDEKCGEATFLQKFKGEEKSYDVNLYEGNAYLIFIYEYKDKETGKDKYSLNSFWCDKTHMNRCLGIDKRYKETFGRNMYSDGYEKLTKIRLNKNKCKHTDEIISAMSKAFDNLDIEVYSEG